MVSSDTGGDGIPDARLFRELGILTYRTLSELATAHQEFRIDRLVPTRSIGLLVGDSGLGKTALSMMEGLAIASGKSFLGFGVQQGRVLYCDAESGVSECLRMITAISSFLGLESPPQDFHIWSPYFDPREPPADKTAGEVLCEQVLALKPAHVIVDPLRAFWPDAEDSSRDAMAMIRELRQVSKDVDCSWKLNHHRRKRNHQNPVSLENDHHTWFEEAAGSMALVNASDVRLGLERATGGQGDLILAGFLRNVGWSGSLYLERVHDADGDPQGYRLLTGVDRLNPHYQQAFRQLSPSFRFKDALAALGGTSGSNTSEFLKQCAAVGVLRKNGTEYVKVE